MILKKSNLVKKRNVLNEIRPNTMSLTEMRFFSIYLSKIRIDKPEETRVVRFPLDDFKAIMELESRINIQHMQKATDSLLCKIVNIRNDETGGYAGFQLFKECAVDKDSHGNWYVEIDAHDKALPLMFSFKNNFFRYKIENTLRLKSPNQHRMYELLKQYEGVGWRIFEIDELKELIGVGKDEYEGRWDNFKKYVLIACQQALAEHTDIKFTYEPHGKRGKGGKILALKFIIEKNDGYADQLTLDMYIENNRNNALEVEDPSDADEEEKTPYQERIEFFMEACDGEFTFDEVVVLQDKMRDSISKAQYLDQIYCYHYINNRYKYMELQKKQRKISKRFGYMKSLMDKEI